MSVKSFFGTIKGKLITAVVGVLAVAGIITAVLLLNGQTYRSIIAKEVTGTVNVVGEINNGQAYAGERLYGGDDVTVMDQSSLTMLMDNDKYLFAEANTHFVLKSEQSDNSSRIRIVLDKGSVLNELRSKLAAYDSYDVDTPNSTMSVRGTKFKVSVYTVTDIVYALLEVSDGAVLAQLRTLDGTYTGTERTFYPGESVLIRGGRDFAEFVNDAQGETVRHLDLSKLPAGGTDRLTALLDNGTDDAAQPAQTEASAVTEATTTTADTSETTTADTSVSEDITEDTTTVPEPDTVTETSASTAAPVIVVTTTTTTTTTAPVSVSEAQTTHVHSFGEWMEAKAAGCETKGLSTRTCPVCGATEKKTIPALGHRYGKWKITKAAGCENKGTETRICSVCGKTENRTINATGHKYGDWTVAEPAGCETEGKEERKCSACGKTLERSIAATGHKYGVWVVTTPAGCENKGVRTRTCSVCGHTEDEIVSAYGHSFSAWTLVREASCGSEGLERRVCSFCGKTEERSIPKNGRHHYVWLKYTGSNDESIWKCSICGATYIGRDDPNKN